MFMTPSLIFKFSVCNRLDLLIFIFQPKFSIIRISQGCYLVGGVQQAGQGVEGGGWENYGQVGDDGGFPVPVVEAAKHQYSDEYYPGESNP